MPPNKKAAQFKKNIDKSIDKKIQSKEIQKLKKIGKNKRKILTKLRKELKDAFLSEWTQDLAITKHEQQLIFSIVISKIPETIIKKYKLLSFKELMRFVGLHNIEEQKKYIEFRDLAKKGEPILLFAKIKEFIDEPWAEKIIRMTFPKGKGVIPNAIKYFKNKEWAWPLIKDCIEDQAYYIIENYKDYKDQEWAHNVPDYLLNNGYGNALFQTKKFKNESIACEYFKKAAKKSPKNAVQDIDFYYDQKWAIEIIQKVEEINKNLITRYLFQFDKAEWAEEYLKKFTKGLSESETYFLFQNFSRFRDTHFAMSILMIAAQNYPYLALKYYGEYFNEEYGYSVIEIAAKHAKNEDKILFYDILGESAIKDLWGNKKAVTSEIIKNPKSVFDFIEFLEKTEYAENLLVYVAKKIPVKILTSFYVFLHKPWTEKVMKTAIDNLPVNYFLEHKNKHDGLLVLINIIHNQDINLAEVLMNKIKAKQKDIEEITHDLLHQVSFTTKTHIIKNTGFPDITNPVLKKLVLKNLGEKFWKDEAVQHISKIKKEWLIPRPAPTEINEYRVMISRNLYITNQEINSYTVLKEYSLILNERKRFEKMPLFKDRNIVYLAHNERYPINFADPRYIHKMKELGASFDFNSSKSPFDIYKTKMNLLVKIANTKPPLLAFLNTHGSPDGLYFTNYSNIHINSFELAFALNLRNKKYPNEPTPILLLESCNNHIFLRNVFKKIINKNKLPIIAGQSEYGQLGYGNMVDLIINDNNPTLGDLIRHQKNHHANISVFIPRSEGNHRQLADNKLINKGKRKLKKLQEKNEKYNV